MNCKCPAMFGQQVAKNEPTLFNHSDQANLYSSLSSLCIRPSSKRAFFEDGYMVLYVPRDGVVLSANSMSFFHASESDKMSIVSFNLFNFGKIFCHCDQNSKNTFLKLETTLATVLKTSF